MIRPTRNLQLSSQPIKANRETIMATLGYCVTRNEAGQFSAADATVADIFTTLISTDKALFGTASLLQTAALVLGGMTVNSYRIAGSINPFTSDKTAKAQAKAQAKASQAALG